MRSLAQITVLSLAACGGSNPQKPDATVVVDTAPPAPLFACTPSNATGAVTVDGPTSTETIQVTFLVHDPTGAVISTSAVMGSGATATLDVPACGMVSVVDVDSFRTSVFTWVNVQPGDHLVDLNRVPPLVTRDLSVQLPALANATDYEVRASCSPNSTTSSSTSSPGTLTLSPHCSSSSVTIVASATTPSATSLAAMTVPLAASGTTSIVVSGYAPPAPSTATLHGFTTFTKAFYATFTAPSGNVLLVGDPSLQSLTSGAATLQGAVVAGAGGVELDLEDVVTGAPSHSSLVLRGVAALPSAIDFGPTDILPAITATLSTAGRPTVTWSTAAPVQGAAAVFELHPAAGSDDMWSLVVPPTPGTVPFPDLPANVWTSTAPVLASADLYESAAVTTYNANNLMTVLEHFPAAGEQIRASSQDAPSSTSRHRLKSAY